MARTLDSALSGGAASGRPRLAPPWRRLNVLPRLLLLHGAVLTVLTAAVLYAADRAVMGSQVQTMENVLAEETHEYSRSLADAAAGTDLAAFTRTYLRTHVVPAGTVLVVQPLPGAAVSTPGAGALLAAGTVRDWIRRPPAATVTTDVVAGDVTFLTTATPITDAGGHTVALLIASANRSGLDRQGQTTLLIMAGEAGAALAFALAAAYLLLRRVLRTVAEVTDTAAQIGREGLGRRIGYQGPDDEVGRLARTFDAMLARVDTAFQAQRGLLSNVSHQLRTPLTVIRGHLEVLRRRGYAADPETRETVELVLDEMQHTERLVDELLLLGRSLEPDFLHAGPVDLRIFMADLLEAARALAPRRWSLDPVPDVVVVVDEERLRGAMLNLIDNAVKATGPDDEITLTATSDRSLVLTVRDTGSGVDIDDPDTLFTRYVRADSGQRGSGLGLSIVRAVARAHGGDASMESAPGRGCTVRITLPANGPQTDVEGPAA